MDWKIVVHIMDNNIVTWNFKFQARLSDLNLELEVFSEAATRQA